jgi:hypothetical protein
LVDPPRRVQRCFVQILDNDVDVTVAQLASVVSRDMEPVALASADAMNFDAIDELTLWRAMPGGCHEGDSMPGLDESSEYLVEVDFGTARPGIFPVEPVEDENVECHQRRVRGRLSTPTETVASLLWDRTDDRLAADAQPGCVGQAGAGCVARRPVPARRSCDIT